MAGYQLPLSGKTRVGQHVIDTPTPPARFPLIKPLPLPQPT
jgi:hypothetical protein